MKKIILAPDSFKGTMSATEICGIMKKEIEGFYPDCQVVSFPVADGGEGTVAAMVEAVGGRIIETKVKGPFGEDITSFYGLLKNGTAVIEMAAAAGLPMVRGREDPMRTTTYGVGQLIKHAVEGGAKNILVGLGGSCTNDGGCGAVSALGVRFFDKDGAEFLPTGGTLRRVDKIDISEATRLLEGVSLRLMCDVDNPLYGPKGAAYIFAPQKGADEKTVEALDEGLRHLGGLLENICPGVSTLAGGGAAGGMGAGLKAMIGAGIVSGIDGVLDAAGFEDMLVGCDLVITGEGRIDGQSLRGKVVFGVCRRAKKAGVPVCAVVGDALDDELTGSGERGLCAVFPINRRAVPFKEARLTAKSDLAYTVKNMFSFIRALEK